MLHVGVQGMTYKWVRFRINVAQKEEVTLNLKQNRL